LSNAIAGLTPEPLWQHFVRIAAIPRPSKKEEKIAAHIVGIASSHRLEVIRDETGNVLVRKPASRGRESSPIVALQSHIDMVCEKNKDVAHDFDRDGISLVRSDGYITARGTTLGSDNGIGVAAALSVMLDASLEHGPLEFLFTVDEETGLTGAAGLKPGFLKSRILLNLDSEEDGALYVGCSGGRDTLLTLPIRTEPVTSGSLPLGIAVTGLRGGHSGLDINSGRANAIKVLTRALWHLVRTEGIRLERMEGGSKRNAIPREAEAIVHVKENRLTVVRGEIDRLNRELRSEYSSGDPQLELEVSRTKPRTGGSAFTTADQSRLLDLLFALPHGVTTMSADIAGLVETSTNVATVQTGQESVVIGTSQRSSISTALDTLVSMVGVIGSMAGARVEHTDGYPGWKPNVNSAALKTTKETYRQMFGAEPAVKAIHAGLECGIIGERFPGMDMVSFGPTIEGAHSPAERVEIATVQKFWNLLTGVLKNLA
jgi:dipeptidase D